MAAAAVAAASSSSSSSPSSSSSSFPLAILSHGAERARCKLATDSRTARQGAALSPARLPRSLHPGRCRCCCCCCCGCFFDGGGWKLRSRCRKPPLLLLSPAHVTRLGAAVP
ncbi:Hypothetical predicted protein [Podarcis lilfordi]|uniref:Uncharacterized protein n=1 Tax=Podarcis lilfordi TaxID=74358 RepID=A0AA35L378_9SAUR|nr:Hypothetical predicted protein [Podarcis lilfordi]